LKVVGLADRDPLFPDDTTAPGNRRIIIILLREPKDRVKKSPEPPRIFGIEQ
jgi:hypothetical protein